MLEDIFFVLQVRGFPSPVQAENCKNILFSETALGCFFVIDKPFLL
jgi:hypothetical protein